MNTSSFIIYLIIPFNIYINLSKAIDTINHNIFLSKINQKKTKVMCMNLNPGEHPPIKINEEELGTATSVLRTVYRKISQSESTKQGIATVAYVTYGNLTYTA